MARWTFFGWAIIQIVVSNLYGQSVETYIGSRAAGMGYSSTVLSDGWSLFNNVSGLANIQDSEFDFSYELAPSLPGGNRTAALMAVPTRYGVGAFGIFRFGDEIYSEQFLTTAFSNKVGHTSLGIRIDYTQYRALGFAARNYMGLTLGGMTSITPKLLVGAYIQNINQPKLSGSSDHQVPVRFVTGIGVKPSDQLLVAVEVEKILIYPPTWRTGIEYSIGKKIMVRTGFNVHPNAVFFGMGFQYWKVKADYSLQYSTNNRAIIQASASYFIFRKPKNRNS